MIETEKKYKLTKQQFDELHKVFAEKHIKNVDIETNVLYDTDKVLRIRRIINSYGESFLLTFKDEATVVDGIKSRPELESFVSDDIFNILEGLGYNKSLVYDKNRLEFYNPDEAYIIYLDELPFGYYMEIEGTPEQIKEVEESLPFIPDTEIYSYPDLTKIYGKTNNGVVEARFP